MFAQLPRAEGGTERDAGLHHPYGGREPRRPRELRRFTLRSCANLVQSVAPRDGVRINDPGAVIGERVALDIRHGRQGYAAYRGLRVMVQTRGAPGGSVSSLEISNPWRA